MSETIRQSELRNDNASVMRRVADGQSFVVTVNGRPVADVIPHQPRGVGRRFVPVDELAELFEATPVVDAASWRDDIRAADTFLGSDVPADPFGTPPR